MKPCAVHPSIWLQDGEECPRCLEAMTPAPTADVQVAGLPPLRQPIADLRIADGQMEKAIDELKDAGLVEEEEEGCPVGDPSCTSRSDECHDACEAPALIHFTPREGATRACKAAHGPTTTVEHLVTCVGCAEVMLDIADLARPPQDKVPVPIATGTDEYIMVPAPARASSDRRARLIALLTDELSSVHPGPWDYLADQILRAIE